MNSLKLYSNKNAQKKILDMFKSGRVSHSFLITGPKGCGKKAFAKFLTAMILCEHPSESGPCFACNSCLKVMDDSHPDVLYAEHFGKRGGFKKDYLREKIVADAYIKPNDSDYRVFVLADCESFSEDAQNVMLKIIEEPPAHAKFIFTAPSKSIFLPTILSRVFEIELFEPTAEDCINAMRDMGLSDELAASALERFGPSISKCIAFANGNTEEKDDKAAECAESILNCIIARDEYGLSLALSKIPSDRETAFAVINILKACLRDAIVCKSNVTALGNMKNFSDALAKGFSQKELIAVSSELSEAASALDRNVNQSLLFAAACANISTIWR